MAKNKHPNGQTMGPKMAKALKIRCDALEDCVLSQQKVISERESEIVNMKLSYDLMKRRYEEAMKYLELNRPEVLQLMKVSAKHGVLASQGKLPTVNVKLVKRRLRTPQIPQQELPLSPADQKELQTDYVTAAAASIYDDPLGTLAPTGPQGDAT